MEAKTYLQALRELEANPWSEAIDGHKVPNLLIRHGWEEGKAVIIIEGKPRIVISALNPSTGRHLTPEPAKEVYTLTDLGSKEWELIDGSLYF